MFSENQHVQIINHSEPSCNGQYGVITSVVGSNSSIFYTVQLDTDNALCICTADELMEG
jgi:hypothetical protein